MPVNRVTEGFCAYDDLGDPLDRSSTTFAQTSCFAGAGFDCSAPSPVDGAPVGCLEGEWCCSYANGEPTCTRRGILDSSNPDALIREIEVPALITGRCRAPVDLAEWTSPERECPYVAECGNSATRDRCENCVENSECGWCAGFATCLPGSDAGPIGGVDCGTGGWIRDAPGGTCALP